MANYSTTTSPTQETSEYYYFPYDDDDSSGVCEYEQYGTFFLPVIYSLFFVVGLLGNVLVLWVIIFGVKLRSMSDVCLFNLAIADLLLVCSLPFLAHQARDQWVFGDAMCKMVLGSYHIGFYCGIFFIVLMSIDRYLAIVHAVYALKARTLTFGMITAAATWVAGFLATFPDTLFLVVEPDRSSPKLVCDAPLNKPNESSTRNRHFWTIFGLFKMNVLGLLVPMTIMGFCYAQIIWKLLHTQSSKKQSIRLVLVVVAVYFCCWMPYCLVSMLRALELLQVYPQDRLCAISKGIRLALPITQAIAYFHSCLNPVLYVFVGERFRKNLLRLIKRSPCGVSMKALIPSERFSFSRSTSITSDGSANAI